MSGCTVPAVEIRTPRLRLRPFEVADLPARLALGAAPEFYRFIGGKFHCGAPWSPYGVTVALKDCADHGTDGSTALVENLLTYGNLAQKHSPTGWPSFTGWPTHDSNTHESTYWKWLERAWRGGLRLMVNDVVENRGHHYGSQLDPF